MKKRGRRKKKRGEENGNNRNASEDSGEGDCTLWLL